MFGTFLEEAIGFEFHMSSSQKAVFFYEHLN